MLKKMNEKDKTVKSEEIEEMLKALSFIHNRLLRIEKWMLRQEEVQEKAKPSPKTDASLK
jgi:hypothetical protein